MGWEAKARRARRAGRGSTHMDWALVSRYLRTRTVLKRQALWRWWRTNIEAMATKMAGREDVA